MKKITLSAAILALAMMGCSDAGLDNSVASTSTNEVKSEKAVPFLAKLAPEPLAPSDVDPQSGYRVYDYTQSEGIKVHVHSRPDERTWKGRGRATLWIETPGVPDVSNVLLLAVANCRWVGSSVKCDQHRAKHMSCVNGSGYSTLCGPNNVPRNMDVYTPELGAGITRNDVGVMAAYASIWKLGTNNENTFSTATYGGNMADNMAYAIYTKYLLQANKNLQQNRCIDYVPNETDCSYYY